MKFASLNDLYLQQLKDLHSAESQLIKVLPKMAKAARNPDLKNAFIEHLGQTKGHLERLKQVAEKLGKRLAAIAAAAKSYAWVRSGRNSSGPRVGDVSQR